MSGWYARESFNRAGYDRAKSGYPVVCLPPDAFLNLIHRADGMWRLPWERPEGLSPSSGDDENGRTEILAGGWCARRNSRDSGAPRVSILPDWLNRTVTDAQTRLGLYDGQRAEPIAIHSARDLERLAAETARTDLWTAVTNLSGAAR